MGPCLLAVAGLLAGCSSFGTPTGNATGYVKGFDGAVAADEPQAALAARNILAAGGDAADAAVAAYFTMSVTLPTAASLGSGGVCLIYDSARKTAESLDFTAPTSGPRAGIPIPASPRGMFALHAKYGRLPWTQLVGSAESLARLGSPASRALAHALAANPKSVADPATAAIFADKSGNPVAEGASIQQPALAGSLSLLRRQPAQFYTGPFARRLARDYQRAGVNLTVADLRAFVPRFRPAVTVSGSNQVAFFPPTPAGITAAQIWAMLYREGTYSAADKAVRPHLLAEVSKRAYADAGRWFHAAGGVPDPAEGVVAEKRIAGLLRNYRADRATAASVPGSVGAGSAPVDQGSASVIAADVNGQAVACSFTMNGVMGTGRIAPGSGIVIAAPPDPAGRGVPALALMALGLGGQWQLEYMGAVTGGAVAPVMLTDGAARMLLAHQRAARIMDAPRFYDIGGPDRVVIEDRRDARDIVNGLRKRGHNVETVPTLGRADLFVCPAGFGGADSQCDMRTDPRGFGFAQLY